MTKRFLACFCVLMMVCACALAEYPVTVTDTAGREQTIASQPETVVSLAASNTEILFALGLGERVTGVDENSNYPLDAMDGRAIVGGYNGPNVEKILALNPDVAFAANYLQQEAIDQLTQAGVAVLSVEASTYAGVFDSVQLVADVMGVKADEVLTAMRDAEKAALDSVTAGEKTVYYALSYGAYGDWSAGAGTFIDEMIAMAGGVNICHDMGYAWPMYSLEQLLAADPDVILVPGDENAAAAFCALDGYKDLSAVQSGNVYALDNDACSRPGPRVVEALGQIVAALNAARAK